jgi:hypothetical protein
MVRWDKFFKDSQGKLVVWQTPNVLLIIWFVSALGDKLFKTGQPHVVLYWISTIALVIWAGLEVFRGASYFRRMLGLVVLGFVLTRLFL